MHANPRDTERIGLALAVSFSLHLFFMILMLAFGGDRISPERPRSTPVKISFVPALPEPEPQPAPALPEPEPQPTPAPTPTRSEPTTPRTRSAAESSPESASPGPANEEFEEFVPGPTESTTGSFSSGGSSTARGGRPAADDRAALRSDPGMSSRDRGTEEGEAEVRNTTQDRSQGSALSDEELAALEEALSGARTETGGGSGSAGNSPVTAPVAAEGFRDLTDILSYRGASYGGLPPLSAEAAADLEASGAPEVEVNISFRISPQGTIRDLQTTAFSRYPALDAFLRAELPRVLSFEPLPQNGPYADLWQEVDLRLSVKSN